MRKLNFSNADTRLVFADRSFAEFSQLMTETALGTQKVSKEEADEKIREIMFEVLGVEPDCNRKELRKAIRRHKIDVYEVIEETITTLLVSGWGNDPFMNEFVEIKSASIGDTNSFYTEDDTVLTVAEVSGNHHDFC